jgi:hypothetical protein
MQMKTFKQYLNEKGRCWTGYKPVPGKKAFSAGSCVKEDGMGGGAVAAGPTNTAGGGQVAGIGVGPKGEPGVDLRKKKKHADPRLPMGIGKRKDF